MKYKLFTAIFFLAAAIIFGLMNNGFSKQKIKDKTKRPSIRKFLIILFLVNHNIIKIRHLSFNVQKIKLILLEGLDK